MFQASCSSIGGSVNSTGTASGTVSIVSKPSIVLLLVVSGETEKEVVPHYSQLCNEFRYKNCHISSKRKLYLQTPTFQTKGGKRIEKEGP